jgi:phospholipid/cholesterol/gamma-HCH transport system substrate-binding protein
MTRRRGTASLVASPVLVGAITVLISIIAVFIAYNANKGLPFVPTYDVKAQLPSGAKLVKGNEVRVGGFRVGVVDDIKPATVTQNGVRKSTALVSLKLDKTVEPLSTDSTLRVRPRSALGLKYVQIIPGRAKKTYTAGDTIPERYASQPLELEDVLSTFDRKTRPAARAATEGFGDAFAGRGQSLNTAIQALNPFFRSLTPVMRNLADPDTQLDQFFRQIGRTSAQVSPVAHTQAVLFTNMADTFAAISADPRALQATIEKSPPTLDTTIHSLPVQRSFYVDFADLSRRLRPAARELPRSLPKINRAFAVGTPILPQTTKLNARLQKAFKAGEDLFDDPNTLLTLKDIRTALAVAKPAIQFIAPYQTVCNYTIYFIHPLGELQSQVQNGPTGGGTVLQNNNKLVNSQQPNNVGTQETSRPWDVSPNKDPRGATDSMGTALGRLYGPPYMPAIDAQGNADCQNGQVGWFKGPLSSGGRYPRGFVKNAAGNDTTVPSAGNWAVTDNDLPGLRGGTYKSRQLGINNLRDVK